MHKETAIKTKPETKKVSQNYLPVGHTHYYGSCPVSGRPLFGPVP